QIFREISPNRSACAATCASTSSAANSAPAVAISKKSVLNRMGLGYRGQRATGEVPPDEARSSDRALFNNLHPSGTKASCFRISSREEKMQQHVKILAILHIVLSGLGILAGLAALLFFGGLAGFVS